MRSKGWGKLVMVDEHTKASKHNFWFVCVYASDYVITVLAPRLSKVYALRGVLYRAHLLGSFSFKFTFEMERHYKTPNCVC